MVQSGKKDSQVGSVTDSSIRFISRKAGLTKATLGQERLWAPLEYWIWLLEARAICIAIEEGPRAFVVRLQHGIAVNYSGQLNFLHRAREADSPIAIVEWPLLCDGLDMPDLSKSNVSSRYYEMARVHSSLGFSIRA